MQPDVLVRRLEHGADAVAAMLGGLSADEARARPRPDAWSPLEVIGHLLDEEREDFRPRLDIALHRPDERWMPIDPQGWVAARDYNGRDPSETLDAFRRERELSLEWLRGLARPDWDATTAAPWGPMRAGDLLAAWAAHDTLHLRQLVELRRVNDERLAAPYRILYAGDW